MWSSDKASIPHCSDDEPADSTVSTRMVDQHLLRRDVLDHPHQPTEVQVVADLDGLIGHIAPACEHVLVVTPDLVKVPGGYHVGAVLLDIDEWAGVSHELSGQGKAFGVHAYLALVSHAPDQCNGTLGLAEGVSPEGCA